MPPITLAEAKAFLRVTDDAEDALIQLLIEAATERVERAVGQVLTDPAPAPLRVAVLMLVAWSHEQREGLPAEARIGAWLAPFRSARL